jgi:hypothetical protein
MPHFCGRTHSTRDRRLALAPDEPRARAGDPSAPAAPLIPGSASSTVTASANSNPRADAAPGFSSLVRAHIAPTREQIAALAYSYWEARGRRGGSPEEDWLRAEQELRNR